MLIHLLIIFLFENIFILLLFESIILKGMQVILK